MNKEEKNVTFKASKGVWKHRDIRGTLNLSTPNSRVLHPAFSRHKTPILKLSSRKQKPAGQFPFFRRAGTTAYIYYKEITHDAHKFQHFLNCRNLLHYKEVIFSAELCCFLSRGLKCFAKYGEFV